MKMNSSSPTEPGITVWLVEDDERFRANMQDLINETAELVCDLAVDSCEAALTRLLAGDAPDTMLMDIGLPGLNGIEGIQRVKSIAPSVRVIMLTVFDDNDRIFQAICAGASGYLLKSAAPDEIIRSLKEILGGGAPMNAQIARKVLDMLAGMAAPATDYGLTNTERRILQMLVAGDLKKQIAYELGVSFHTIDTHLRNIYAKLQVHSRSGEGAEGATALTEDHRGACTQGTFDGSSNAAICPLLYGHSSHSTQAGGGRIVPACVGKSEQNERNPRDLLWGGLRVHHAAPYVNFVSYATVPPLRA